MGSIISKCDISKTYFSPNTYLLSTIRSVDHKWCRTYSEVVKLSYNWTIDNVSFCLAEGRGDLSSPNFFADDFNEVVWCIKLKEHEGYIGIYLKLVSSNVTDVRAKFKFAIINNKEAETNIMSFDSPVIFVPAYKLGYRSFVLRSFMFDKGSGLLLKDKLTIACDVQFVAKTTNISNEPIGIPACTLSQNFRKLLDNKKFCDVLLVVDGHEFPAHKSFLAARSDVFAAMFEHELEENKLNRVTITDIHHEVFKELLDFIYTGEAPNLDKLAGDLLEAADKYSLERLKAMCAKSLSINLSVNSVAKSLVVAHLHDIPRLKAKAMAFTKANIREVAKTKDWKNLTTQYSYLIAEICSYICLNSKPPKIEEFFSI